jgi:hypothetical protein
MREICNTLGNKIILAKGDNYIMNKFFGQHRILLEHIQSNTTYHLRHNREKAKESEIQAVLDDIDKYLKSDLDSMPFKSISFYCILMFLDSVQIKDFMSLYCSKCTEVSETEFVYSFGYITKAFSEITVKVVSGSESVHLSWKDFRDSAPLTADFTLSSIIKK